MLADSFGSFTRVMCHTVAVLLLPSLITMRGPLKWFTQLKLDSKLRQVNKVLTCLST